MKYYCHSISDNHPYNGGIIGWCIRGNNQFVIGGFLNTQKAKILELDPGAEFEESFGLKSGEEEYLREGLDAYRDYTAERLGRKYKLVSDTYTHWLSTKEEVWNAIGKLQVGEGYEVYSLTDEDVSEFIPL